MRVHVVGRRSSKLESDVNNGNDVDIEGEDSIGKLSLGVSKIDDDEGGTVGRVLIRLVDEISAGNDDNDGVKVSGANDSEDPMSEYDIRVQVVGRGLNGLENTDVGVAGVIDVIRLESSRSLVTEGSTVEDSKAEASVSEDSMNVSGVKSGMLEVGVGAKEDSESIVEGVK